MSKKVPEWNDDVMIGAQRTVALLNHMLQERSQLYGTIIYLMQLFEKEKVIMPPTEAMREYHNSLYVMFDQEADGNFYLSIHQREDAEEVDDGEESS